MGRLRQLRKPKRLDVHDEALAVQHAALEELRARLAATTSRLDEMADKLAHLHPDDVGRAQAIGEDALARAGNAQAIAEDALGRAAAAEGKGVDALARAGHAQQLAGDVAATADLALDSAREALLPARVAALSGWLTLCPPVEETLISVVLPTRDRPALLPRAVASLLEQLYQRWELVVVDDGDTDAVEQTLGEVEDDRVVAVEGPRRGLGAARNAGLDAATGDVVCYLDDDNVMDPLWLRAVAHVFAARDDVDVAYGVTLAEHRSPGTLDPAEWWPSFWQLPWSRQKLLEENLTDAGALAHRRELPGARFDEAMGEDWDLLIRLTTDRPALAVPAISHAYAIGGGDHMSRTERHRAALDEVRRRHVGP